MSSAEAAAFVSFRSFSGGPASPGEARAFARATLTRWDLSVVEDVILLLVSELSTNVVLHARTSYDVSLERREGAIRLTVLDGSAAGPVRRRAALRSATGRGLALVETLSTQWGRTEAHLLAGRAKGIWCEVPDDALAETLDEGALYGEDWLALLADTSEV